MRILKILCVLSVVVALGACSCRTRKVGAGEDNIASVSDSSALKDIQFAFDSYSIDASAKSVLQENAKWLQGNSAKVQIEGHCDERGTNEYNMVLGANRARAAQDFLRSVGISSDRLSTVSYGEELPLDPAHNEAAWAKNRRDHFSIQK